MFLKGVTSIWRYSQMALTGREVRTGFSGLRGLSWTTDLACPTNPATVLRYWRSCSFSSCGDDDISYLRLERLLMITPVTQCIVFCKITNHRLLNEILQSMQTASTVTPILPCNWILKAFKVVHRLSGSIEKLLGEQRLKSDKTRRGRKKKSSSS